MYQLRRHVRAELLTQFRSETKAREAGSHLGRSARNAFCNLACPNETDFCVLGMREVLDGDGDGRAGAQIGEESVLLHHHLHLSVNRVHYTEDATTRRQPLLDILVEGDGRHLDP